MVSCLPLLLFIFISCNKEASLTPDKIPDFYTLPQGNQPYDDSIVAFHQKYGSYILYKFTAKDLSYSYTRYLDITGTIANPVWVGNTLTYFKSECLNYYPESFLKKTLPFKILLAAYLDTLRYSGNIQVPGGRTVTGFAAGMGLLAIGWADSTLPAQLPARAKELRGYMHAAYMKQAVLSGAIQVPAAFKKYGPESYLGNIPSLGAVGLLQIPPQQGGSKADIAWDFACYIAAITSHTKAQLDATILGPAYDVNGKVQLRYNDVIQFYRNEYGIDLQAIGNHP